MAQTDSKGKSKRKRFYCDEFGKKITLELNPERSRKMDCEMVPKKKSKPIYVERDESQNMSTSKNSVVSLPNLKRKKGIKRPLDDPNPSNVSKLYFI